MPLFPKNPQRLIPYANFRFKVKWDRTYVLGVSKVSGLIRPTQVIQHREGGDPSPVRVSPGQSEYSAITLERGVSYDVAFGEWVNKAYDWTNSGGAVGQNTSLLDFRKNLTLEVYNEAGMKVIAYNIYNAWVSEFRGVSEFDGAGNALIVQSLVLQNEGWERDGPVVEVTEPTYVLPTNRQG